VGTPAKANTGDIKPISGIEKPDDTTIVFHLKSPSAPLVSQALVMPITTPVPKEYAAKFDTKTPSTYDQYVAFTGPYMVKHDMTTGKVTGRVSRQVDRHRAQPQLGQGDRLPARLSRRDRDPGGQRRPGHRLAPRARRVGHDLLRHEPASGPGPQAGGDAQQGQVLFAPAGGVHYVSFKTTVKPFDNINIRKAIIASSDREALRLTTGGAVSGGLASGWLPPGLPGYEEAGGTQAGRTRSRCSTRRSTATKSSSRATSTGPSSTCRPSTPP
jgi:peptide/nickel transport system substrate-binding protein